MSTAEGRYTVQRYERGQWVDDSAPENWSRASSKAEQMDRQGKCCRVVSSQGKVLFQSRPTMPLAYIERGRFKDDDERRRVMLERERPELDPAARITDLEAQLAAKEIEYGAFAEAKRELGALAQFLRDNYAREIAAGEPQHQKDLSTALLYYLQRERRIPRWLRWLL